MATPIPKSVKLVAASVFLLLLGGSGFVAPVFGVSIPSPFADIIALCIFAWPIVLIAAVVERFRERGPRK